MRAAGISGMRGRAAQRGMADSWPALVVTVLVAVAAVYSFSARPLPPFPETRIHPQQILINGLARSGTQILAAGEQGRILIASTPGGDWREAKVEPQRGSTLTQIHFINENTAIAVGHDGWIIRSTDKGENWTEVSFTEPPPETPPLSAAISADLAAPPPDMMGMAGGAVPANPLMGIAGPYHGKLFAFGGFGELRSSSDEGKTWQALVGDNAIADRHLNAMTLAADGSLLLVGERGLMARSQDAGQSWQALPQIYTGSFFGALTLENGNLLVFGMRGNAFYSSDNGLSWTQSQIPGGISLFGGAVEKDGAVVLAGEGETVLRSTDGGASFKVVAQGRRERLTAVLPVPGHGWLAAGEGGITMMDPAKTQSAVHSGEQP